MANLTLQDFHLGRVNSVVGATSGFVHLPQIQGAPTGVPSPNPANEIPAVIQNDNGRLWTFTGTGNTAAGWVGAFSFQGGWSNTTQYNRGDAVSHNNDLYVAAARNMNSAPNGTTNDKWTKMVDGEDTPDNRLLPSFSNDDRKRFLRMNEEDPASPEWETVRILESVVSNGSLTGTGVSGSALAIRFGEVAEYVNEDRDDLNEPQNRAVRGWQVYRDINNVRAVPEFIGSNNGRNIVAANDEGNGYLWRHITAIFQPAIYANVVDHNSAGVLKTSLSRTKADGTTPADVDALSYLKIGFRGGSTARPFLKYSSSGNTYGWASIREVPDPSGHGGEVLTVNSAGNGFDWAAPPSSNNGGDADWASIGGPDYGPSQSGYVLKVNTGGNSLLWAPDNDTDTPPRAFGTGDPEAPGTASPGASMNVSRSDHVHPLPTSSQITGLLGNLVKTISIADSMGDITSDSTQVLQVHGPDTSGNVEIGLTGGGSGRVIKYNTAARRYEWQDDAVGSSS